VTHYSSVIFHHGQNILKISIVKHINANCKTSSWVHSPAFTSCFHMENYHWKPSKIWLSRRLKLCILLSCQEQEPCEVLAENGHGDQLFCCSWGISIDW